MIAPDKDPTPQPRRRDLVVTSAFVFAGAGALVALWPFISALTVTPGDEGETTAIDLDTVIVGTSQQVIWRGKPYIVRHRTVGEAARSRRQVAMIDRFARNENLEPMSGATEENRSVPGKPRFVILSALCTKGDCLVRDRAALALDDDIGWMCGCCASRYDLVGRVVSGPAPQNLPVPRYKPRDGRLVIGAR